MVTDYARKIMSRASGRNYIFPIFFRNLPTFPCFLPYFLGLPVPPFSLLFAGKPMEALGMFHVYLVALLHLAFQPSSSLSVNRNGNKCLLTLLALESTDYTGTYIEESKNWVCFGVVARSNILDLGYRQAINLSFSGPLRYPWYKPYARSA